jgi:hypothetical protein
MRPRSDGVAQPLEAVGVHVILRAERPLIQDVLGALIDDRAFVPLNGSPCFSSSKKYWRISG